MATLRQKKMRDGYPSPEEDEMDTLRLEDEMRWLPFARRR